MSFNETRKPSGLRKKVNSKRRMTRAVVETRKDFGEDGTLKVGDSRDHELNPKMVSSIGDASS
jgi:hypothetical protein